MGLNPPNPGKAYNTVVYIVVEALGFHIVFVESYNHLSPNVEIYMCQIRMICFCLMTVPTELVRFLLKYSSFPQKKKWVMQVK